MFLSLKQWAFAGLIACAALSTPLTAQSYSEQDSYSEACPQELSLAYRWNMMLVQDHFTATVELGGKVYPVPQAYLWAIGSFPHPTYKGGTAAAYNAMKPLAKQFHAQLSDEEKTNCEIIMTGSDTNHGPLGKLLEGLM